MLGVMNVAQGLTLSKDRGFDLVEVSPKASPPVCKIMDYGKYKYEQQKKAHQAKKKQKVISIKEIKLRPNIADGDYNIKLKKVIDFISQGSKVKVTLMFRGREIAHNSIGFKLIEKFCEDMSEYAKAEAKPKLEGRNIYAVLAPITTQ